MTYQPFILHGPDRPARWMITCDHASNTVPDAFGGSLGLPASEMERHIAFDPGAAGVAKALADLLDAPALLSNFSRLVIDPNRGDDDPTLVMKLYDGTIIPGNRHVDAAEITHRKALCYAPYHDAYATLASARPNRVICAVHTFTHRLNGRTARPWEVGVLYAHDARLAHPLISRLRAEGDLTVGDNEPYEGHLPGDAIDRHALAHGRPNVLLEIRQDLLTTQHDQVAWAARLAPLLKDALRTSGL